MVRKVLTIGWSDRSQLRGIQEGVDDRDEASSFIVSSSRSTSSLERTGMASWK